MQRLQPPVWKLVINWLSFELRYCFRIFLLIYDLEQFGFIVEKYKRFQQNHYQILQEWWHNHTSLMHKLQTFGITKDFLDHQKLTKLSGNFPDYLETCQINRNFARPFGHFPDFPETFQSFWKLPRLSGNCPGSPEIFQAFRNLYGPSRKYPDYPESSR